VIDQKKNYIQQNLVETGFAENDFEYLHTVLVIILKLKDSITLRKFKTQSVAKQANRLAVGVETALKPHYVPFDSFTPTRENKTIYLF
jgi:hypothetical protein